jgi:hypothetical protein
MIGRMVEVSQSLVPQAEPNAMVVKEGMRWRDEYKVLYEGLSIARYEGRRISRGVRMAKGLELELKLAIMLL